VVLAKPVVAVNEVKREFLSVLVAQKVGKPDVSKNMQPDSGMFLFFGKFFKFLPDKSFFCLEKPLGFLMAAPAFYHHGLWVGSQPRAICNFTKISSDFRVNLNVENKRGSSTEILYGNSRQELLQPFPVGSIYERDNSGNFLNVENGQFDTYRSLGAKIGCGGGLFTCVSRFYDAGKRCVGGVSGTFGMEPCPTGHSQRRGNQHHIKKADYHGPEIGGSAPMDQLRSAVRHAPLGFKVAVVSVVGTGLLALGLGGLLSFVFSLLSDKRVGFGLGGLFVFVGSYAALVGWLILATGFGR
jgi:hypothetical protein